MDIRYIKKEDISLDINFLSSNSFLKYSLWNCIYDGILNKNCNIKIDLYVWVAEKDIEHIDESDEYASRDRSLNEGILESGIYLDKILDEFKDTGVISRFVRAPGFDDKDSPVIKGTVFNCINGGEYGVADDGVLLTDLEEIDNPITEIDDYCGFYIFKYNVKFTINKDSIQCRDEQYYIDTVNSSFYNSEILKDLAIYVDILNRELIKDIELKADNDFVEFNIMNKDYIPYKIKGIGYSLRDKFNNLLYRTISLPYLMSNNIMSLHHKELFIKNFAIFRNAVDKIRHVYPVNFDESNTTIIFSKDNGFYLQDDKNMAYHIRNNSKRFRMAEIIIDNSFGISAKSIFDLMGEKSNRSSSMLSKEIGIVNTNIKKHLGISDDFIEHNQSCGYFINKNIVVKRS